MVVKFIRRAKVLRESWVKDDKMGMIPMEVFLLSRLHHPNIVKVFNTLHLQYNTKIQYECECQVFRENWVKDDKMG